MYKGANILLFSKSIAIILLSFIVLFIYGYFYYVQSIKRAWELMGIFTGEIKYKRLRE